jgi:multiple antibiotic resistance protein
LNWDEILSTFIVLWAVIDPIGTVPVFIAVTRGHDQVQKKKIALKSSFVAFCVLTLFLVMGEFILRKVGVPLSAFQTSGGLILLLFALNMIFGDSKPEEEIQLAKKNSDETAIFPLAIPSIAGPGACLAVVLLAEGSKQSYGSQFITAGVLVFVLLINFILMRLSHFIHHKIGNSGAIVISKIMGLILASMAANNILMGIREFFKIRN